MCHRCQFRYLVLNADVAGRPLLLLMPGAGGGFELQPSSAAANTIVVPSYGSTSRKTWKTRPAEWIMDFAEHLVRTLGRRIRLLGFSMGASWSFRLVPLSPELFEALALVAGYPSPGAGGEQQAREAAAFAKCKARSIWVHSIADSLCPWQSGP